MSIIDAVNRFVAALNSHDTASITDALSPNATYLDPNLDAPIDGKAAGQYVGAFLKVFPDAHWDIVTIGATSENTAAIQWRMTGTHKRNGKPVVSIGGDFYTYDADTDRLGSINSYFDVLSARKQIAD
jgi:hypothetical protein